MRTQFPKSVLLRKQEKMRKFSLRESIKIFDFSSLASDSLGDIFLSDSIYTKSCYKN